MKRKITDIERKNIEINILKYITEICDNHNLTYFLGGGTLLGAIRHNGFIPWDDDIDIMMPRNDYDKLRKIMKNKSSSDFLYLEYKEHESYYYPFAKLVYKKTELIEFECDKLKDMGVYIDIFPIDNVSDDMQENKKLFKKYKMYDILLGSYKMSKEELKKNNIVKRILRYILKWYMSIFNNYKKVLEKMENLGKKYPNSNTVACITRRYFEKEIMPKSYIEDFIMAKFEDREYKIPKGYDLYLTKHYGDYMQLPPKEKQVSNHDNIAYWRE